MIDRCYAETAGKELAPIVVCSGRVRGSGVGCNIGVGV